MQIVACAVVTFLLAGAAGCRGDGSPQGPSATVTTPPSTTTTLSALEREVEEAYLRSWEVFRDAALALSTEGLSESYAENGLEIVRFDIERLRAAGTPGRYEVEHSYRIRVLSPERADVADRYLNHSVVLDPITRKPLEEDPNEHVSQLFVMRRIGGQWKVVDIAG